MYRNLYKSKLLASISTDNTIDLLKIKGRLESSKENTSSTNINLIDQCQEAIISLPLIKENQSPKSFKLKFTKNNNKELIRKKILKGKLIKLINNSLFEEMNVEEENKVSRPKKLMDFIQVDHFPNLIGSDIKYVRRNIDTVISPEELIFKNFNQEDIELIKSNANYFKINSDEIFKNIDLFKNRHLLEILEEENAEINTKTCKKKVCKTIMSTIEIKKIIKGFKKENILKSPEEISETKVKEEERSSNNKLINEKKLTKFCKNLHVTKPIRRYVDVKAKFLKYEERKNEFLLLKNEIFKKKLEKNNSIRMNADKNKKAEFEENFNINTYSRLIKENYTN